MPNNATIAQMSLFQPQNLSPKINFLIINSNQALIDNNNNSNNSQQAPI